MSYIPWIDWYHSTCAFLFFALRKYIIPSALNALVMHVLKRGTMPFPRPTKIIRSLLTDICALC